MSRLWIAVLCLTMVVAMQGYGRADDVSLDPLKRWVTDQSSQTIWDDPLLQKQAQSVLDDKYYQIIFGGFAQQVVTPVEQKGDVLYAFACKAHACNTDNVRLFVDLNKNKVAFCLHVENKPLDIWLSSGKKERELDKEGCVKKKGAELYNIYGNE